MVMKDDDVGGEREIYIDPAICGGRMWRTCVAQRPRNCIPVRSTTSF
jgi:hypothetical protein